MLRFEKYRTVPANEMRGAVLLHLYPFKEVIGAALCFEQYHQPIPVKEVRGAFIAVPTV